MKVPSLLCVLAGAGLARAFIAPQIPVGRQLGASTRRGSQRDIIVASAGEPQEVCKERACNALAFARCPADKDVAT